MTDLSPARSALLAAAQAAVGATYPAPEYLALVAPGDTGARQAEIGRESGCALVALGIQEAALACPPRGPYRDGSAFEVLYDRARGLPWKPGGAVRLCGLDSPPQPGDAIVYGASVGAVAHVDACVVTAYPTVELEMYVIVVAGGQRDALGAETVKSLGRTLRWVGHCWQDTGNGRDVLAVVDADLLGAIYAVRE